MQWKKYVCIYVYKEVPQNTVWFNKLLLLIMEIIFSRLFRMSFICSLGSKYNTQLIS
jgi:hypothetical protein